MVRLLAIRASIAAGKQAISLSKRLKPSTWELLAMFSAALFVLSVWGFGESQRRHIKPGVSTVTPEIVRHSLEGESSASPLTASLEDSDHSPGSIVTISDHDASDTHPAVIVSAGDDTLLYVSSAQERSGSRQASIIKPWVLSHRYNCNAFVWGEMDSPAATKFDLSGYVAMYAHLRPCATSVSDGQCRSRTGAERSTSSRYSLKAECRWADSTRTHLHRLLSTPPNSLLPSTPGNRL
jgi:hypothetical protein